MSSQQRTHLKIARAQFAATGLTVLDSALLAAADPTLWPSVQEQAFNRLSQKSLIADFFTNHPSATFFEFRVEGGGYVAVARSLVGIEGRVEALIGVRPNSISTFLPGSTLHAETSRIPELRRDKADEFDSFDPEAYERSLPTHDCHLRRVGLEKLERFQKHQTAKAVATDQI